MRDIYEIFTRITQLFTHISQYFWYEFKLHDLNISALAVGQSRGLVILNLGQPTKPWLADNKRTDVFELERGNQQSLGRATGHAVMDRLTLGGWELIGTPLEGLAGDTMTRQIEYDEENTVKSVITVESNQAFSLKSQGRSTSSVIVWPASWQVKRISPQLFIYFIDTIFLENTGDTL